MSSSDDLPAPLFCGYCGAPYPGLRSVRGHITKTDDEAHRDHTGQDPDVVVLDLAGDPIETSERVSHS